MITLYILIEKHVISNELLQIVGVFSDVSECRNVIKTLTDGKANLTGRFDVIDIALDKLKAYHTLIPKVNTSEHAYEYISEAIKLRAIETEINEAVKSVTLESINKILNEILDCVDNPEVVREYIQGLRDNVEDYL